MANFSPTTLPDPNTAAVNFVQSGAGAATDFSSQLQTAAKIGERVHGVAVAKDAFEAIENEQNTFLENRNEIVEAEAELALLKDQNPIEAAIVNRAEKRIKELQNFVDTGGISPSRAASEVEAIRRKAINQAPIFASEIQGFSGSRGIAFDTETEQLIKERNDSRDFLITKGLNPDNPKDIEKGNRLKQLEFENNIRAQETVRDSRNAEDLMTGVMGQLVFPVEQQVTRLIESVNGDVTQIDAEQLVELQGIINLQIDTASNTINQMLVQMGFKVSNVDPKLRERLANDLVNDLNSSIAKLDGSLIATTTSNQLTVATNKVMLNLRRDDPGSFNLAILSKQIGTESVAGQALSERLENRALTYWEVLGNPGLSSDFLGIMFRQEASKDSAMIQGNIAGTLRENRRFFESAKTPDQQTLFSHGSSLVNVAKNIVNDPRVFSKEMVNELMDSVNSPKFMKHFEGLGDGTAKIYSANMGDALQVYSRERTVPDIKRDITDSLIRISRGIFDRGVPKTVTGDEYIKPVLSPTGTIRFEFRDNDKFDEAARAKAKRNVMMLNNRYSNLSTKIVLTSFNLSKANQADDPAGNRREQAIFLFQELFPNETIDKGEE